MTAPACASPCAEISASHEAFRALQRPGGGAERSPAGAHVSLSVPYELIDALVDRELSTLPSLPLPIPDVGGIELGSLRLAVESVRARQAPGGELGFRLAVVLRQGKRTVTTVQVDTRVRPRLDPSEGSLAIALNGRDITALQPSLDTRGRKQLGDWLWSRLPPAARAVMDRSAVSELSGELAEQLASRAGALVRRELLDDLGELVRFEFDLPEALPVAAIELRAGERYLDIDLRTPLPVATPLPAGRERVDGLHPNLIQVRLSGDALAALANHAIREGRIDERWNLDGEPDPKGDIYVGVGWVEGVPNPLEILLWKREGDCAQVTLRGQPHLAVAGAGLELGARDAKVESVVGSFKIRAGLFFNAAARRGVTLIERSTASTAVSFGDRPMQLRAYAAEIRGDEVVLGLRMTPAQARP